ncbi:MAG: hypothetical protein AAF959_11525, partial [Cyanobacteria bacterium P01_D01_bin.56]
MVSLLRNYCQRIKFPVVNIPEALFDQGILEQNWHTLTGLSELLVDGYLYLGFRSLPTFLTPNAEISNIDPRQYRACLLVRDPRDCLV